MKTILLLVLAGVLGPAAPVEVIHLGDGREIKAPVVKETAENIFVDLGFTILGIPKKEVVRRTPVVDEKAAADQAAKVDETLLWRGLKRAEASVKENVERVSAGVVLVQTPSGSGSGFILNPDGYMITNDHVIQGDTKITVTLFEVENGVYKINKKPKERKPIADWLKPQARFRHVFKPGNEHIIEHIQAWIDSEWEKLLKLEAMTAE